jgi:hypothetical protein
MQKSKATILIEAIVVGISLILLFNIIQNMTPHYSQNIQLFITGALFHLLCEISGINLWYVENYVEILNK